jgi:hypothetical protein
MLQRVCHGNDLPRRLHWVIGTGDNGQYQDGKSLLFDVVMTYSCELHKHLRRGIVE